MADDLGTYLDLELAWRRVQKDLNDDRTFIQHPFERALIEVDAPKWLAALAAELSSGGYAPGPVAVWPIPKGRGFVRPGATMSLWDQVVYTACVGACLPRIRRALTSVGDPIDFSYHFSPNDTDVEWLRNPFLGWKAYRDAAIAALDAGASFVVKGDVVGCYENLSLRTLASDLNAIDVPTPVVRLLLRCLQRWAQVAGRGLPQGFSASDILAKLYLSRIDQTLKERGYSHQRYVDDFIVFTADLAHAKEVTIVLTGLLRKRGLNIQSAKTAMLTPSQARQEIDQVGQHLQPLAKKFIAEIAELAGIHPEYLPVAQAEALLQRMPNKAPLVLLEDAYLQHFVDGQTGWNKTLFHYLLNRLGNAGSRVALGHSLNLLQERPEETTYVLRYLERVTDVVEVESALVDYLGSRDAVYVYQKFQIVRWRTERSQFPSSAFVDYVRGVVLRGGPSFLQAVCRQFLGRFGTVADLDALEDAYDTAAGPLEKAEVICCLSRLELSRRNALLATARGDGEFPRRATVLVSKLKRP